MGSDKKNSKPSFQTGAVKGILKRTKNPVRSGPRSFDEILSAMMSSTAEVKAKLSNKGAAEETPLTPPSSAPEAKKKTVTFDETPRDIDTGEPYTPPPRPSGGLRQPSRIPVRVRTPSLLPPPVALPPPRSPSRSPRRRQAYGGKPTERPGLFEF